MFITYLPDGSNQGSCVYFSRFEFQSKSQAQKDFEKLFYFINLNKTSKKSVVQILYYLFTKAGVLSLGNTGGAGAKKKSKKCKTKFPYFMFLLLKGDSKRAVCIGRRNKV